MVPYSQLLVVIVMPSTSRLRDNIEELRRSMQPKEDAIEALQQSLSEKEHVLQKRCMISEANSLYDVYLTCLIPSELNE